MSSPDSPPLVTDADEPPIMSELDGSDSEPDPNEHYASAVSVDLTEEQQHEHEGEEDVPLEDVPLGTLAYEDVYSHSSLSRPQSGIIVQSPVGLAPLMLPGNDDEAVASSSSPSSLASASLANRLSPSSPNTGATLHIRRPSAAERKASIQEALDLSGIAPTPSPTPTSEAKSASSRESSPAPAQGTSVSDETLATLVADTVSIRRWLVCFCVVNFDLNVGQTLEWVYPIDSLDENDVAHVCNLAFPDSNVSQIGDSIYSFSLRLEGHVYDHSSSNVFGVSFFRQQRDESNARGYFQKSVVLLSALPFIELFESIVEIVGPLYFSYGTSLLEAACRNISEWPDPNPCLSTTLEIPLLGHVLESSLKGAVIGSENARLFSLALYSDDDDVSEDSLLPASSVPPLFGTFTHVNVFREFRLALGNLWCLWEIALTGRALLVVASCPVQCSRAVLGLVSLIAPLPFRGDFRPYFTVSDPDYQHYSSMHSHGHIPCTILGVTNPFFLKAFENFPNILCLGAPPSSSTNSPVSATSSEASVKPASAAAKTVSSLFRRRAKSRDSNIKRALSKTSSILRHMNDAKLVSQSTPLLLRNEAIIDRLIDDRVADIEQDQLDTITLVNNHALRDHFRQVTEAFLAAFDPYFKPVPVELSHERRMFNPYLDCPKLATFSEDSFLESISSISSTKSFLQHLRSLVRFSSRNAYIKLYTRFLRAPHFFPWFNEKREIAQRNIDAGIVDAILTVDVSILLDGLRVTQALQMKREVLRRLRVCNAERRKADDARKAFELSEVLAQHLQMLNDAVPSSARDSSPKASNLSV